MADDRDPARTKLGVIEARSPAGREPATRLESPRRKRPVAIDHLVTGSVVLERYRLEDVLGGGATSTVFRGRHLKLGRGVAIKVLHDGFADQPKMRARFRREAEAAGRLRHPNVSGVIDIGETASGHPVMVMELVDGPSLAQVMRDAERARPATGEGLARDRIVRLVRDILRGLDHAHAAGLVHRDLKPANVIVERDDAGGEIARLVDFGIAALTTDVVTTSGRLTDTGALIGTPMYMAPEQARGEQVDHRADLYALGVIVFQMLSGADPFAGSALEIVVANMNEDVPAIADRAPAARPDPVLELFLRRLVARDPAGRFASAHAALAMLEIVEHDPADAALRLGRTDVARALAVIGLPARPR